MSFRDAVLNNDVELLRTLTKGALALESLDANGYTPLLLAAVSGLGECATILLDAKADVNTCDAQGLTPLHFAAQCGKEECVQVSDGVAQFKTTYEVSSPHLSCSLFVVETSTPETLVETLLCIVQLGVGA